MRCTTNKSSNVSLLGHKKKEKNTPTKEQIVCSLNSEMHCV